MLKIASVMIQRLQKFPPFHLGQRALRRYTATLFFLVLIVMGLPALSGAQQTCRPDGDVDQNGSVTAADALLAFQQVLSLSQLSACQLIIADVFPLPTTPDGTISTSDALCIFQKALSLPSCLDIIPPPNEPPTANAGADQSVEAGAAVALLGTASDPDGTIVGYLWEQTGGTTVSPTGVTSATAAFTAPDVLADETLTFRLTVADDDGAQANDEVRVTVRSGGNTFAVGNALPGVPTSGSFIPATTSGAGVSSSTGSTTITFNHGGYIQLQDGTTAYTCQTSGGCEVRDGVVTRGTIVSGTAPSSSDLVVSSSTVSDRSPDAGQSFTLSATVLNQGEGQSAATTLRYYRSTDTTISSSDTPVGTDAVGSLAASDSSSESISLTAPSGIGTYYYGACVDSVAGESDTANNCSPAVAVNVAGDGVAAESFDLHADNDDPTGIAYASPGFYVVNWTDLKVYAYSDSGQRNAAADFDLHADNDDPIGITYANARFYVVDGTDPKVYAYSDSGQREAAADFDLHADNDDPAGITYANPGFYFVDGTDLKVYVYSDSGQREAAADFDLHADNDDPTGITYLNARFYVVDGTDFKVYAYSDSGQREAAADFDLHADDDDPTGITYVDSQFYVVDGTDFKGYGYSDLMGPNGPDLIVRSPTVSESGPNAGESFTFSAVVRNQGNGPSPSTRLGVYRSTDTTITASDTSVYMGFEVPERPPLGTLSASVDLTAPSSPGTYYYGACVDVVPGESDTTNNCSASVQVTVSEQTSPQSGPNLVVYSISLASSPSGPGAAFTLHVRIRNDGEEASPPTTLRYYRSADARITASDTSVGTDAISGLGASARRTELVDLTAPSSPGTYYYGACVDVVEGESNTTDNCSVPVTITIAEPLESSGPELIIQSRFVSTVSPEAGQSLGHL